MPFEVGDHHRSIRFKHGVHTIVLFIDMLSSFNAMTEKLLGVLRERYPLGLTISPGSPRVTKIPTLQDWADKSFEVQYGVLINTHDVSQGWRKLDFELDDIISTSGEFTKEGMDVAFRFGEDAPWQVEYPQYEEEDMGQEEEDDD